MLMPTAHHTTLRVPPGDDPVKPLTWQRTVVRVLAEDAGVPDSTRLLIMALTLRAPGKERARIVAGGVTGWDFYASNEALGDASGLSKASIQRAKHDLIRRGMLIQVSKGGRKGDGTTSHSVYRLALPSPQDELPI